MVDNNLGPLKAGSTHLCVPVCGNDATSSKSASAGRAVVDDHMHTNNVSCAVCVCGSKRCKTCTHVSQGSTFRSTVTHKNYSVVSPNLSMTCDTESVTLLHNEKPRTILLSHNNVHKHELNMRRRHK